jgi:hypothetical protein
MARITVLLSRENSDWLRQHTDDPEAYVNEAVRKDQARKLAEAELRKMIQEGLESGIEARSPPQIMQDVRDRLKGEGADIKP